MDPTPSPSSDPVADALRRLPLTPAERSAIWRAAHGDAETFTAAVDSAKLPQQTKSQLWQLAAEANRTAASRPQMNRALVNGKPVPVEEEDNLGTAVKHFAGQVNPVPLGQLLPFPKEAGGAGWDAPIQAVKNIAGEHGRILNEAVEAYHKGDYVTAARKAINGALLGIGIPLDKASDEFAAGKPYAGTGDAVVRFRSTKKHKAKAHAIEAQQREGAALARTRGCEEGEGAPERKRPREAESAPTACEC
jgi:hypothetical protein